MKISTEAEYQTAMRRLEHLVDHEPTSLAEITALGNVVNAYENDHGHRPVHPNSLIARLEREMRERQLAGKQMADLLGIAPGRLRDVLRGKRGITLDLAKRLHTRLSVPGDFILEAA